jgi:hypothetical protein
MAVGNGWRSFCFMGGRKEDHSGKRYEKLSTKKSIRFILFSQDEIYPSEKNGNHGAGSN